MTPRGAKGGGRSVRPGGPRRKRSPSSAASAASALGRKAKSLARQASERASEGIEPDRGVFMISVAAELAEMHPQTLRMYEARGLIAPKRSPRNTRLYSQEDVERLRRIQAMTVDEGLNLAGVETVLDLEEQLAAMRDELGRMRKRAAEMEERMEREVERVRKSFRAELVPYGAYESKDIVPAEQDKRVRIPIERRRRGK